MSPMYIHEKEEFVFTSEEEPVQYRDNFRSEDAQVDPAIYDLAPPRTHSGENIANNPKDDEMFVSGTLGPEAQVAIDYNADDFIFELDSNDITDDPQGMSICDVQRCPLEEASDLIDCTTWEPKPAFRYVSRPHR